MYNAQSRNGRALLRGRTAPWAAAAVLTAVAAAALLSGANSHAQQQGSPAAPAAGQTAPADTVHGMPTPPAPAARGGLVAYPDRPKAPQAVLDSGKAQFSVNCAFCHGSDAGGGSVGPNLLRSEVVLQDKHGELIAPIVHGARVDRGMPKIDISDAQIGDIADWLHSLKVSSRSLTREKINIVVGDATVGKATFARTCGSCHSVDGDLKGFAAKYTDPRAMQQAWIMPAVAGARGGGGGPAGAPAPELHLQPATVTVTTANGTKVTGKLDEIDDFFVSLTTDDGTVRRFMRNGETPKVEIHDPLAAHRELLRKYNDKDIHDITAYLEGLK